MEKVLLWGTGVMYRARHGILEKLVSNNYIEILALINRDNKINTLNNYKVIRKDQIKYYNYDKIIIMACGSAAESIMDDIHNLGIDTNAVMTFSEYIMQYPEVSRDDYQKTVQTQLNCLKKILSATDKEITDYVWMSQTIAQYGIFPFQSYNHYPDIFLTEFGVMQILEEFTKYCNFIGTLTVDTAIEIGVFSGRSSYLICALLSRKNPDLKYTMVDISDRLDSFDRFQSVLPALNKVIPSTSADYKGRSYDFVFIDADHSYDASLQDYYNVGQYAKQITCFHDIYAHEYDEQNGGTVRMWKEVMALTSDKEHKIFSAYPDRWMGIGCIIQ